MVPRKQRQRHNFTPPYFDLEIFLSVKKPPVFIFCCHSNISFVVNGRVL